MPPFPGTLASRIAMILALGMVGASAASLLVAEQARRADMKRAQTDRVVASASDVIRRIQRDPANTLRSLRDGQILGAAQIAPGRERTGIPDPSVSAALTKAEGRGLAIRVARVAPGICLAPMLAGRVNPSAGFGVPQKIDCWVMSFRDRRGDRQSISLNLLPTPTVPNSILNPLYLVIMIIASTILSVLISALATAPMRRLAVAARAFAQSIDAEPIAETGPTDVRAALSTFNLMQRRVREGMRERTQMLASITHDLQTPLTRLRLRLEQVADEDLRERLIADLGVTLDLVRRGLDFARSGEVSEEWSMVDIDSLLSSIAGDLAEVGVDVVILGECGVHVRTKPDALIRAINNLIDNALKYAGSAELSARRQGGTVTIEIRDHGPGIPPELMSRIFRPFVRGDARAPGWPPGHGLGLAIAKTQIETIGGRLEIENDPRGGVRAAIALPFSFKAVGSMRRGPGDARHAKPGDAPA